MHHFGKDGENQALLQPSQGQPLSTSKHPADSQTPRRSCGAGGRRAAATLFPGFPSRGGAHTGEGQASGSPQAQTAPHYEAACSCAPLEIKAAIYSAHPNGAPLYGAGHKDPKQVS